MQFCVLYVLDCQRTSKDFYLSGKKDAGEAVLDGLWSAVSDIKGGKRGAMPNKLRWRMGPLQTLYLIILCAHAVFKKISFPLMTEHNVPRIAVVILNFNGKADTLECLDSLFRSNNILLDIIVVDNGSADDSVNTIKAAYPAITIIENIVNRGFGAGCNQGIKKALERDNEYIALLNNDAIIAPEALYIMASYCASDPRIGAIGPLIYYRDDKTRVWSGGAWVDWVRGSGIIKRDKRYKKDEPYDVDTLSGCCLMIPRAVISECGFLEEKLFLYWEDTDLCLRIGRSGRRIVCAPSARAWHKVGESIGGSDSIPYIYYNVRNRLYFISKYNRPYLWPVFFAYFILSMGMRGLGFFIRGERAKAGIFVKGTKDFFLNRYGPFSQKKRLRIGIDARILQCTLRGQGQYVYYLIKIFCILICSTNMFFFTTA